MARVQVDSSVRAEALQNVTAPRVQGVNARFDPRADRAFQLAESLSTIMPTVNRIGDNVEKMQEKSGLDYANSLTVDELNKQIKDGSLSAAHSPVAVAAIHNVYGQNLATRIGTETQRKIESGELTFNDPNELDKYLKEQRQTTLGTSSKYSAAGFDKKFDQFKTHLLGVNSKYQAKRFEEDGAAQVYEALDNLQASFERPSEPVNSEERARQTKDLFKFFKDPKIPKEQKLSYSERLNKMGVDVKNLLKKSGKKAALITVGGATLLLPFKNNIQQYLRQQAPHVAQLVNTRDITQDDFRSNEVKMMGMLINNAIKDGQSPEKGVVTYKQYRSSIAKDVASGDMMSVKNIMNQLKQDPEVLVAMTLGQFSYQKNDDGSYTVTDKYDFSKWKTIDTKKDDVKDLSYPAAIAKIMKDNNVNIYPAIRHMAYLESPDDVPGTITKKAVVNVPAKYVTTYDLSATSDIPYD
jgi:hypothetical protein